MAEIESRRRQDAGRIKDARGRKVTQLDPVTMHLLRRHDTIEKETLREIAQEVGFGMTKGVRLALWSCIACLVAAGIAVVILSTRLNRGTITTRRFFLSLVPYCGVFTSLFGFWIGARNVRHQRIGKVMLEHLRCPHCGYDIRGLPVEPADGATVCPECGCAWKLDAYRTSEEGSNVTPRLLNPTRSRDAGDHRDG